MTVSSRCVLDKRLLSRPTAARTVGLTRKHVLMLALAIEVLAFGVSHASRYQRPAVVVNQPATIGHAIV